MSWFTTLRSSISLLTSPSRAFSTTAVAAGKEYKLKTHQGAKKRWKAMPSGDFKRWKCSKTHNNSHLARARLHTLGLPSFANAGQRRQLKRLLPYA
ncbi:hypothetical protein CALVIDRAFT_559928 [Calocera viscosa TUFC12733]|uniref:50S ribosomal protein L35 n=1 Tax=Calocera viscosa (strain TUFC12733) TaxID=1330018 RepID=A0A167RUX2_CALVF|nr:hypothetical protein CALVIDRAFT_559928 [Calocera viscosa TUFC12733]